MAIYYLLDDNNDVVVLILEGDDKAIYIEDGIEFTLDDDEPVNERVKLMIEDVYAIDFIDEPVNERVKLMIEDVYAIDFIYVDDEFASCTLPLCNDNDVTYDDEFASDEEESAYDVEESAPHVEESAPLNESMLCDDKFVSADDDYHEYHEVNYDNDDYDPDYAELTMRVSVYYMNHPDKNPNPYEVDPDIL